MPVVLDDILKFGSFIVSQHIVKNRIQMYFELKKKEITNSRIFHSSRRKKSQLNLKNILIYIYF